jgi:hypothetical protein
MVATVVLGRLNVRMGNTIGHFVRNGWSSRYDTKEEKYHQYAKHFLHGVTLTPLSMNAILRLLLRSISINKRAHLKNMASPHLKIFPLVKCAGYLPIRWNQ